MQKTRYLYTYRPLTEKDHERVIPFTIATENTLEDTKENKISPQ